MLRFGFDGVTPGGVTPALRPRRSPGHSGQDPAHIPKPILKGPMWADSVHRCRSEVYEPLPAWMKRTCFISVFDGFSSPGCGAQILKPSPWVLRRS